MTQTDLFGITPLAKAVETGHQQATRAAQKADQASPGWLERAVALTALFASKQSSSSAGWLLEDVRVFAEVQGLPHPPDKRAWGQVVRTLKKQRRIECVGYSAAASSNGSPKCLWMWVS